MGNFSNLTNQGDLAVYKVGKVLELFFIIYKQQIGRGYPDNFMQTGDTPGYARQQRIIDIHFVKLIELHFYFWPDTQDTICKLRLFLARHRDGLYRKWPGVKKVNHFPMDTQADNTFRNRTVRRYVRVTLVGHVIKSVDGSIESQVFPFLYFGLGDQ